MKKPLFLLALLTFFSAYSQVGIGTETPQSTLHVNGTLQVTNELNVGGDDATAGDAGTSGQILSSNGTGEAPQWKSLDEASIPKITFLGRRNSASQEFNGGNETLAIGYVINKIDPNVLNHDEATGIFTVSKAGYYQITVYNKMDVSMNTTAQGGSQGTGRSRIQKNNSITEIAASSWHQSGTNDVYHSFSGVVYFAVGDTFTVRSYYTKKFKVSAGGNISVVYFGS